MSFFVYHRSGECVRDPQVSLFPTLLDELEERLHDEEHISVSIVHESQWSLAFLRGGYVSFENVESDEEPRHMNNVPRIKLLELMERLSTGNLDALERERWEPGY